MKICIVTDAWRPQVNGVAITIANLIAAGEKLGHEFVVIGPEQFLTIAAPSYPEIRLALTSPKAVGELIRAHRPDHIHIATEGPLGVAASYWCPRNGEMFTTSYHTRFPGICRGALADSRRLVLCRAAQVPFGQRRPDGRHPDAGRRSLRARLPAADALAARRRPDPVPAGRGGSRPNCAICRARSSSIAAAWRRKRTSRLSCRSTCRGRRSSSATARRDFRCRSASPTRISSA